MLCYAGYEMALLLMFCAEMMEKVDQQKGYYQQIYRIGNFLIET